MPTLYLETKDRPKTEEGLVSDVIRHWHSRHLHSKALVLCDDPVQFVKLAKKQWLRLMQRAQQERLKTVDADAILDLTYAITRMQHVTISEKLPHAQPAAHLWAIRPGDIQHGELPVTCRSIYIATGLSPTEHQALLAACGSHGLIVDYCVGPHTWQLAPKTDLEAKVNEAWEELATFFAHHNINTELLVRDTHNIDAIDDALDTLLDVSSSFLRHMHHFQEVLFLAEPLSIDHATKKQYDMANSLARRVAALSPNVFSRFLTQSLDDETFYLQDKALQKIRQEQLQEKLARHRTAGRNNLVRALERAFMANFSV